MPGSAVMTLPDTAERGPLATDRAPNDTTPTASLPAGADILALSAERDAWERPASPGNEEAYLSGYRAGVEQGRALEAADRDAAHRVMAARILRHPLGAELDARRWGPGGRAHAGDPRPGDYPGRGEAA